MNPGTLTSPRSIVVAAMALLMSGAAVCASPDVLVITIDTLRSDHMSSYGYSRETSPNLDSLIENGVAFTLARTIEPLTSPALCSLITSRHPSEHGSTRNGLKMRSSLDSLPKELRYHGYRTAAFVGSWTLRDKMSGLAEHFDEYQEVLTRRRWFGLVRSEATGEDLNTALLEWVRNQRDEDDGRPLFLWVHYVEPHAPYRLWKEHASPLGIELDGNVSAFDRYDTEIAFIDRVIGELLSELREDHLLRDPLIVFASDHGESLGEHNYWGHGRHLYEATLRIPMSITWPGHLPARKVAAPSLIIDLAPTVLGLLGVGPPQDFQGYDWTEVLLRGEKPPGNRITHYQAHRGAVMSHHQSDLARRSGLLEIGLIDGEIKEIFRTENKQRRLFNLAEDPEELVNIAPLKTEPSETLQAWGKVIANGLTSLDDVPAEPLDPESEERLRALGYLE